MEVGRDSLARAEQDWAGEATDYKLSQAVAALHTDKLLSLSPSWPPQAVLTGSNSPPRNIRPLPAASLKASYLQSS